MTAQGWLQIARLRRDPDRAHAGARRLHGARLRAASASLLDAVLGPVERLSTACCAPIPTREQDWKGYARTRARLQPRLVARAVPDPAHAGHPPVQPAGLRVRHLGPLVQHRGVVRDQHELAVLRRRDDALELHARWPAWRCRTSSRPRSGIAVVRRRHPRHSPRAARATLGNFWVDLTRTLLYVLLPISRRRRAVPRLAGRDPDTVADLDFATLAGGEQTLALGPVASQEVIKELGTNGGGFFNVNSAMPFENPTALTNFFEMLMILHHPGGADGHVRAHGRQPPPGLGDLRRDARRCSSSASSIVYARRGRTARPRMHAAGLDGRQHGGQGDALRHRLLVAVRGRDDGRLVRRGERGDGVADRHRRRGPDGEHDDRRGHLRRRRLGPLRDAAVRPAGGLPRRPDGRPHARVPRQEDRGARGQARRDRDARGAAARARSHVASRSRRSTAQASIFNGGPAGLLRDALRLHVAGQQQRLGVRRLHRLPAARRPGNDGAFGDHVRGPPRRRWRCWSGASCRCSSRSRSPGRSPASGSRRRPGHDAHRHADVRRPADRRRCCSSRS